MRADTKALLVTVALAAVVVFLVTKDSIAAHIDWGLASEALKALAWMFGVALALGLALAVIARRLGRERLHQMRENWDGWLFAVGFIVWALDRGELSMWAGFAGVFALGHGFGRVNAERARDANPQ